MKKIVFSFIFFVLLVASSVFTNSAQAVGEGKTCGFLSSTCDEGLTCVDFGKDEPKCVKNRTLDKGSRCTNQGDNGTGEGKPNACKSGLICTIEVDNKSDQIRITNPFKTCKTRGEAGLLPPPKPPCAKPLKNGICPSFNTALGPFSTSPEGFVASIFGVLLAAAGGIALFLIIRAGYKIMTSQGKPETIQEGRDQLIAAIVGLLFLIFSLVFLQVIGVDILHIPGLK